MREVGFVYDPDKLADAYRQLFLEYEQPRRLAAMVLEGAEPYIIPGREWVVFYLAFPYETQPCSVEIGRVPTELIRKE
jgi:hypothetical protein